jgi:ribosomal 30S subunit maturation factor RimM
LSFLLLLLQKRNEKKKQALESLTAREVRQKKHTFVLKLRKIRARENIS